MNVDQQKLLTDLLNWRKSAIQNATQVLPLVGADVLEVDLIEGATYHFQKAIIDVGNAVGPIVTWKPGEKYTVGMLIWSLNKNHYFECVEAGTSGTSEPSWSTDIGAITDDGTCVWVCRGQSPYKVLSDTLTTISDEFGALSQVELDYVNRKAGWIYTSVEMTIDLTKTPLYVFGQGTPDVNEFVVEVPDVPEIFLVCRKVVSGTFYGWGNLEEIKRRIFGSSGYVDGVFHVYTETGPGSSSVWPEGGLIFKGTKTADQITGHYGYYSSSITEDLTKELRHWFTRVKSYIQTAYAYAGMTIEVVNPFDEASSEEEENGSPGCWELPDLDEPYWEVNGGEYIPALTNKPYYSTKLVIDEHGKKFVKTYEFAIAIKVKCPDLLRDGDTIVIEIVPDDVSSKGYSTNDYFEIRAISISPISLLGASPGDPFQRWKVLGTRQGFDDYILDVNNPTPYSSNGLSFSISQGAVPFSVGDTFVFNLSRKRFRWKTSTSDWSSPQTIGTDVMLFQDIYASFYGPCEVGDKWKFTLPQPYSVDNIKEFNNSRWRSDQNSLITLNTSKGDYLAIVLFCKHSESSLNVTFLSGTNVILNENIEISRRDSCYVIRTPNDFDKVTIGVPTGVEMVSVFVGDGIYLDYDPEQVSITRDYLSESSRLAMRQLNAIRGFGSTSLDVSFPSVSYEKIGEFISLMEYIHDRGDEPVIFSVNTNVITDALFCKIRNIRSEEWYRLQSDKEFRDYTLSLQLQGVFV